MRQSLRARVRAAGPLYIAFAAGFVLGAAMMATPALAVVIASAFLIDLLRRRI